jgi:hypothetical protein
VLPPLLQSACWHRCCQTVAAAAAEPAAPRLLLLLLLPSQCPLPVMQQPGMPLMLGSRLPVALQPLGPLRLWLLPVPGPERLLPVLVPAAKMQQELL